MKKSISWLLVCAVMLTSLVGIVPLTSMAAKEAADYMKIDFNTAGAPILIGVSETSGTATAIPGTDLYGYRFSYDWDKFTFVPGYIGLTAEDIDNGTELAVTVEYYAVGGTSAAHPQIALSAGTGAPSVAICLFDGYCGGWGNIQVNEENLPLGERATCTFTLGKDSPDNLGELAKQLVSADSAAWTGHCYSNLFTTAPIYLLSFKVEKGCPHENTHLENAQEATETQWGYTGDKICDDCGKTVTVGKRVCPTVAANYMQIDFNTAGAPILIGVSETSGTATAIPGTDLYGYRFSYDWDKFTFVPGYIGLTAEDIDNGTELAVTVEYYAVGGTSAAYPQIALSAGTGAPSAAICVFDGYCHWDNIQVNEESLPLGERATCTFTLGKDSSDNLGELAKQLVSADSAAWTGHCYSNLFTTAPVYLLSFTVCEVGKEDLVCAHENTHVENAVDATCTEAGYSGDAVCEDCGVTAIGVTIPAHEVVSKEAEEATCVRNGREAGEWCTVCEIYLSGGQVIAAHEKKTVGERPRSCKEEGYTGDIWCVVCDKQIAEGVSTGMLPHVWDEGKITREATPDQPGEFTRGCMNCDATVVTEVAFVAACGDVDSSGTIDSTDARLTLQYAVKKIDATALDLTLADADGNGRVDSTDARLILQLAVGKIKNFPAA